MQLLKFARRSLKTFATLPGTAFRKVSRRSILKVSFLRGKSASQTPLLNAALSSSSINVSRGKKISMQNAVGDDSFHLLLEKCTWKSVTCIKLLRKCCEHFFIVYITKTVLMSKSVAPTQHSNAHNITSLHYFEYKWQCKQRSMCPLICNHILNGHRTVPTAGCDLRSEAPVLSYKTGVDRPMSE